MGAAPKGYKYNYFNKNNFYKILIKNFNLQIFIKFNNIKTLTITNSLSFYF